MMCQLPMLIPPHRRGSAGLPPLHPLADDPRALDDEEDEQWNDWGSPPLPACDPDRYGDADRDHADWGDGDWVDDDWEDYPDDEPDPEHGDFWPGDDDGDADNRYG